jgi:hypothetical protein
VYEAYGRDDDGSRDRLRCPIFVDAGGSFRVFRPVWTAIPVLIFGIVLVVDMSEYVDRPSVIEVDELIDMIRRLKSRSKRS